VVWKRWGGDRRAGVSRGLCRRAVRADRIRRPNRYAGEAGRRRTVVVTTTVLNRSPRVRAFQIENLRRLHHHGVPIAVGSDHSETSLDEALNLYTLGIFDNATLLRLWCEVTARTIFPNRRSGRLEQGYEASFLVLGGDPLRDFDQVRNIRLRVKRGIRLSMGP
jgi:imidazolonepropionase-like amidohydrolase